MTDKNDLTSQIQQALNESEQAIPESVQKKLAEARAQALLAKETQDRSWNKEWMAIAACLVLVVPIWMGLQSQSQNQIMPTSGLDLMVSFAELDEEEWELVDDLEFALWLSEQSDLAEQIKPS